VKALVIFACVGRLTCQAQLKQAIHPFCLTDVRWISMGWVKRLACKLVDYAGWVSSPPPDLYLLTYEQS